MRTVILFLGGMYLEKVCGATISETVLYAVVVFAIALDVVRKN